MGVEGGDIQDCIGLQEEFSEGLLDNLLDEELAIFESSGFGIEKNGDGVEEYVTYIKDMRIAIPWSSIDFSSLNETSDVVLKMLMFKISKDLDVKNKYGERTLFFVNWYVSSFISENYERIQQSGSILSKKLSSENTFDSMNNFSDILSVISEEELQEKGLVNIQPDEVIEDFSKFGIAGMLYGAFEDMPFDERKEKYLESKFEKGKIEICETIQEGLQELSYVLSDITIEGAEGKLKILKTFLELKGFKYDQTNDKHISKDREVILSFGADDNTGDVGMIYVEKSPIWGDTTNDTDVDEFMKHYKRNEYKNY